MPFRKLSADAAAALGATQGVRWRRRKEGEVGRSQKTVGCDGKHAGTDEGNEASADSSKVDDKAVLRDLDQHTIPR